MLDIEEMDYHPLVVELAEIICKKTQNTDPQFFRILISYLLTKITSMMRVDIVTGDRGVIPVSMYAINLGPSGLGKGHSTAIMEEQVIDAFRQRFLNDVFKVEAARNITRLAGSRSIRDGRDEESVHTALTGEFEDAGELLFNFDSGTVAAIKQFRHKLLLANAGSMNFESDEIGKNLLGNADALTSFLELFDLGKAKPKLVKNTAENRRVEEINGRTPTNMMLFGTPDSLLNGGKEEDEFIAILYAGYARRCFFGYSSIVSKTERKIASDIYAQLIDPAIDDTLRSISDRLEALANPDYFGTQLVMEDPVGIELTQYRLDCEYAASQLSDYQETEKAELSHRYFKVMKLAGTYAFIDRSPTIEKRHIHHGIKLAEDSGIAFKRILSRDKDYVRLAKFIATSNQELTHADIVEKLPFYKGVTIRKELLDLAIAWGYKNNILIKRTYDSDIEFLQGDSLETTNQEELIISYSQHYTEGYKSTLAPWSNLSLITKAKGYHFVNHALIDGYRDFKHAIKGFNLIIIDIDQGVSMDTAALLLNEYQFLMYETKRSTPQINRFRMIFPTNYIIKLDAEEYKIFMENFYEWLPFTVDDQTNDIARKWESNPKEPIYNKGMSVDVLPFIPKTKKEEEYKKFVATNQNMNAMEKWMLRTTSNGNRSNQLIKYAFLLVDTGMSLENIRVRVMELNNKFPDSLGETEIDTTIMQSTMKKLYEKRQ